MTKLAVIDTETTGLHPYLHDVWEVGLILYETEDDTYTAHTWQLPVNLGTADPFALQMGRFFERRVSDDKLTSKRSFSAEFMELTAGQVWVGSNPGFDALRIELLMLSNGAIPRWDYHLVNVMDRAIGFIQGTHHGGRFDSEGWKLAKDPYKSDDISKALQIDFDESKKHTALGDAEWALKVYREVMGL